MLERKRNSALGGSWILVPLLVAVSCTSSDRPEQMADLVLRNGVVSTLAADRPEAQAVAARGPWIVAVGSNADIEPWIGPETQVIDLDGRRAVPGFIEGHGHFLSLGNAKTILDLTRARTWDEIVAMVAAAAERAQPGEWISGRGWHQEKWDRPPSPAIDGSPVHQSLSAASPQNPVLLGHASGHAAFANAKAMKLAGLTRDSEKPPGGELVRDASGNLTGLLRETAQRVVAEARSRSREGRSDEEVEAELLRFVELAGRDALSKGVTSFHDAGASFEEIDFFNQLEAENELPVRLYVMVRRESNEKMDELLPGYRMVVDGDDFLTVRSIKRQIDGALGAHGAWLLEPYSDMPESVGLVLEPENDIRGTAEVAVKHGFQVNTHAIGDRANRAVLDIYEEVFAANDNPADLRWRIEHAQHLHPDDVPRFAELGVIASMQGVHCTSDGPWVPERIGDQRAAEGAYVWRTLIDHGVVINNGTDVPVEDIDPIASFHSTVSRRMNNGELFYPDQRMTRDEALRSYTLNNAYAAFEEDLKGSIEPGKLADITILSRDIMTIPEEEIPAAQVDTTILGGGIRYQRSE
ncbi:MAG: amidohydrolase [bacterium]|nr:amidohydrolase [bacterium]